MLERWLSEIDNVRANLYARSSQKEFYCFTEELVIRPVEMAIRFSLFSM